MSPELRAKLEVLGADLTMEMIQGTLAIFAERNRGMDAATNVAREIAYGEHDRHRLDIFTQGETSGAPVLVFVHGGGFVRGSRDMEGLPFYANVGDFAARSGFVGVTIHYRLAPEHQFPSGVEDLATMLTWLKANIADHGGDPGKIVLMGQSSGAVHVAGYVAHRRFHIAEGGGIAGAVMVSGCYDTTTCDANEFHRAYYGEDPLGWPLASCNAGLLRSEIPLMFTVSENDVPDFCKQAAQLVGEWGAMGGYPPMHLMRGHNHFSPALSIGSDETQLEELVEDFVRLAAE